MIAMQAVRIHTYGGPEVMQLEELPLPVPGPGQVLVRVEMASVNLLDVQYRRGDLANQSFYKDKGDMKDKLPATLGTQGVGIVESIGPDVERAKAGERVNFYAESYATHALVRADRMMPIPDQINTEQAAAGLTQGFVAYELTHAAYPVQPNDWCLVQAAAGGIGLLVCQMAKLRGGRVIGVTSTEDKAHAAKEAGAEAVIFSKDADIAAEARRITGGKGVNVVYDGVGRDTFAAGLNSLAPRGYMMVYGQASGFVPRLDIMTLQDKGSLFVSRNSPAFYLDVFPRYLEDFISWIQQRKLAIRVDRIYPLAEAAQAHAAFEERRTIGRTLLKP